MVSTESNRHVLTQERDVSEGGAGTHSAWKSELPTFNRVDKSAVS